MRLKMKNRLYRYEIKRPWPRYAHKYTKYNMCLSMVMIICINSVNAKVVNM